MRTQTYRIAKEKRDGTIFVRTTSPTTYTAEKSMAKRFATYEEAWKNTPDRTWAIIEAYEEA